VSRRKPVVHIDLGAVRDFADFPPELRRRYGIYVRERFRWWGKGPKPTAGSPRFEQLVEASVAWSMTLTQDDLRSFVHHVAGRHWDQEWDEMFEAAVVGEKTDFVAYIGFKGEQLGKKCMVLRKFATPEHLVAAAQLIERVRPG
jgi:hypothetical protein